jgi:phosphoenolpyruvate-protein phosphotransferase
LSRRAGPAEAASINGILGLGARWGHQLRLRAQGPEAHRALAELAVFLESGCGDRESSPEPELAASPAQATHGQLTGIPASLGIAIGPLAKLHPATVQVAPRAVEDPEAEWQCLLAAIHGAQEETRALYEWAKGHVGANEAGIFDAQLLFLEDPALIGAASRIIHDEHVNAESAWQTATGEFARHLNALEDPYLRARAADVGDVAARVLRRLTGLETCATALARPSILAAHDLAPSEVKELDPGVVLGLCLETGSASAHSVILARAMGIPAVVGLGPGISALAEGTTVALDGERGVVWVSPDSDQVSTLNRQRQEWLAARRDAQAERHKPALTRDGRRIRVFANINSIPGAVEAVDYGAEGVGVLRTEFLFLGRATAPGEQEQLAAYRTIAEALGERPLVVRTLDIGGDKSLPYVQIGEEANPFLGWRGIRVTLSHRDLLRTQLRAILRAGVGHAIEILLPMVSSLGELREAKTVLAEVEIELERDGTPFQKETRIGVMVEVPAAAVVADQLAREVSFFSIGSNDLAQYVMAADRTNAGVAQIADSLQPAVLRMISQAVEVGRQAGIGVTLCGELAADVLATPLLIGLGLEEFSVSAPLIPDLKRAVSRWSLPEAEAIAREALTLDSNESVRRLLLSHD